MLSIQEIKKYSYFKNLSENCLKEVSTQLETLIVPPGTEIVKQNAPADYMYFIKNGEVEVTRRNKHGQNAKITNLKTGEIFGEMALLTCSSRHNTVTALSEVTLYRLGRSDFDSILLKDASLKRLIEGKICDYKSYNEIKTLQPLALLTPEKMSALMEKFLQKSYKKGEVIINEGDLGDYYYIIQKGKASVKRGDNIIDFITVGDGFGEEALIRDKKRNATITALEDVTLFALNKDDFNELLKKSHLDYTFSEDIAENSMSKYVFIDVRIPPEYEEDHIAGAINIPLEELRSKFSELDPNTEYLTYCTNDSRGMAAAFLMASQGFKAKNLRGGLSSWLGPFINQKNGIYYPQNEGMSEDEEDAMIERLLNKKKSLAQ